MTVLVTGGAGYIGAHVVRLLQRRGSQVVVVDDLSTGSVGRVGDVPLISIDIAAADARDQLATTMSEHEVDSVIHVAAKKQVGESTARPAWYYHKNVGGTANLLLAMQQAQVTKMMFSSSAATYGLPDLPEGSLIHEDAGNRPISPYGETKLVCEWMIRAAGPAWGLRSVNLRYFNVAGAGWDDLGDPGIFNLIPIVMRQLLTGEKPQIFGDDYPTPDGTCVRDYVHVIDLADSHLAALDFLDRADRAYDVFNVGTGTGASVIEVLGQVAESTGYSVEPVVIARRPGDPASLVADVTRIQDVLGWKASNSDLATIVDSAWSAWPAIHGPTS
ncbi:MAG: UDP-glucose 4-epimerase GalE [Nocardioidaceae bacterium]